MGLVQGVAITVFTEVNAMSLLSRSCLFQARMVAAANPQNSDSGTFWYLLVPWVVGNAGLARRFYVRPAARQDCPQ